MTLRVAASALSTLLLFAEPTMAQTKTAPAGARSYEDVLKVIPQQDFLKLRDNAKAQAAVELSQKIIPNEAGKDSTFAIKIANVAPWPFPGEGITGTRITAEEETIRMGSVSITTHVFVHIHAEPTDAIAKLKRGQKITVTGKVSRCDLTVADKPVLTIDLHTDSVSPAAK